MLSFVIILLFVQGLNPACVVPWQVAYDFSLKRAVIEVDRDADRRWSFATDKMKLAEDKDEVAPNSAPLEDVHCLLRHKICLAL